MAFHDMPVHVMSMFCSDFQAEVFSAFIRLYVTSKVVIPYSRGALTVSSAFPVDILIYRQMISPYHLTKTKAIYTTLSLQVEAEKLEKVD